MSQPTPWEPTNHPEQRVSHADRDQIAETLRVAAGDGRLTLEELDERLEACFAARTYGDLAPLVADLPVQRPAAVPAQAQVPPKDVVRVERVGGNVRYEGPWLVPKRLEVEVRGGNVLLDFTAATVSEPVTEVHVAMRGGNLKLLVPHGYLVEANEVVFKGGQVVHRRAKEQPRDVPLVHRILVTGKLTGGNVVVIPPHAARRPGRLRRMLSR